MRGRSAKCADCTAMLALGSRRVTHCAHCVRCVRANAASQFWMRAARADPSAALLVAPEIAPTGYHLPRCTARALHRGAAARSVFLAKPRSWAVGSGRELRRRAAQHEQGASVDEQECLRTLARLTSRPGLQARPWTSGAQAPDRREPVRRRRVQRRGGGIAAALLGRAAQCTPAFGPGRRRLSARATQPAAVAQRASLFAGHLTAVAQGRQRAGSGTSTQPYSRNSASAFSGGLA